MSFSNSLDNPTSVLVADASVIINLNATQCAAQILRAIHRHVVVTDSAWFELEDGRTNGYKDADDLQALIQANLIHRVSLSERALEVYHTLIDGQTAKTLDDGEAATIGYAVACRGVAVIDERKARRLCTEVFPSVGLVSTVDVLMHEQVLESLGTQARRNAIVNALTDARMRVPSNYVAEIKCLLGPEATKACTSLPQK